MNKNLFFIFLITLYATTNLSMQNLAISTANNPDIVDQQEQLICCCGDTCCCNYERYERGKQSLRDDMCFSLSCGCCDGSCCLDSHGRIIPLLYFARCHKRNYQQPLDLIPDSDYSTSSATAGGCAIGVASISPLIYVLMCFCV